MTEIALEKLNVDELVGRFENLCVEQYKADLRERSSEYNELYAELDSVDAELKRRGTDARLALLRLYDHPNVQVRLKAGIRTLAVAPDSAKRLLQTIADSNRFPQAANAALILESFNSGSFVPE